MYRGNMSIWWLGDKLAQGASTGSSLATVRSIGAHTVRQYLVTGLGLFALARPLFLFGFGSPLGFHCGSTFLSLAWLLAFANLDQFRSEYWHHGTFSLSLLLPL